MIRSALAGLLLAVSMPSATAGQPAAELTTDHPRYVKGSMVLIKLRNAGDSPLVFESPWKVVDNGGTEVASMHWAEDERTLGPGESQSWMYPQDFNSCSSDGVCTDVGGRIPAGRYEAVVDTPAGELRADFLVGRYFTLGFRSRPDDSFVVFVAKERAARRMSGQARAEEKTLIVSGVVRGKAAYNPNWSYTMGPRSIVLGDVFIEVCDASARYVEKNHSDWMGERWCPWSSYVEKRGR